jgi:hypothetical protein
MLSYQEHGAATELCALAFGGTGRGIEWRMRMAVRVRRWYLWEAQEPAQRAYAELPCLSANARELLANHHVQNTPGTQRCLKNDSAYMLTGDTANDRGITPKFVSAHCVQGP